MLYIEKCVTPRESWRKSIPGLWATRESTALPFWKDTAINLIEEYRTCPTQFVDCLRHSSPSAQYRILELLTQPQYGIEMDPYVSGNLMASVLDHYYTTTQSKLFTEKRKEFEKGRYILVVPKETKYEGIAQFLEQSQCSALTASPTNYLQAMVRDYTPEIKILRPEHIEHLTQLDVVLPEISPPRTYITNGAVHSFFT